MQNTPYISKRRMSIDRMQNSLKANNLVQNLRISGTNEDISTFSPKMVYSITSNKSN